MREGMNEGILVILPKSDKLIRAVDRLQHPTYGRRAYCFSSTDPASSYDVTIPILSEPDSYRLSVVRSSGPIMLQFNLYWAAGKDNGADYYSKHFPQYITEKNATVQVDYNVQLLI
jgi:glutathionyl-hydroquinone reductase